MSKIAIRIEGLSKSYRISHNTHRNRYRTIQDEVVDLVRRPWRRQDENGQSREFWALKDVSLDIEQGEVLGIIGRNGAGKSTLLKILSRITDPTNGYADVYGRMGSLLEVGTGFHPELTGRENIFLNGAILGMRRREIQSKFDEIVAFAEVEQFIDMPVKRYSSGMYTRLAFSVAAHLDPEILVVDEVLAVGDAAFQKKCLGQMEAVANSGRTVLFVSHQMNTVRKLCTRCVWLDAGQIQSVGNTINSVSAYEATLSSIHDGRDRGGEYAAAKFLRWEILSPPAEQTNLLTTLDPVTLRLVVQVNRPIRDGHHGIALRNSENQLMWAWATSHLALGEGVHNFTYVLPTLPLRPGVYQWHVSIYDEQNLLDAWYCVPELIIGTVPLSHPRDEWSGVLNVPCIFQAEERNR